MTVIVRSDDVRRGNRRRVLDTIRREGELSRTDISARTRLSAATVSAIVTDLISEKVLLQAGGMDGASSGRGRPRVSLRLNPLAALVGAVTFQLDSVSAAVIDYAGNVVAENSVSIITGDAGRESIRDTIVSALRDAMDREALAPDDLYRIAVGVQGATDVSGTRMLWSPVTRETNLPIAAWMGEAFGVPASVSNDCDLIALALHWSQPQRYDVNFAAVLLSHGVGMGLFLRGGLINGTRSSGTEFGHMTHIPGGALCRCGARGCIEAYAGDYAIKRGAAGEAPDTRPPVVGEAIDISVIASAAREGDGQARAALEAAGQALGTGLASMYALVDPFPVALVGHGTAAFDFMERPLREALAQSNSVASADDIGIDCFADEIPLVQLGCGITALTALDDRFADEGVAGLSG